jgi:hypothetical protein
VSKKYTEEWEKLSAKGHGLVTAAIERMQAGKPEDFPYDDYRGTISRLEEIHFSSCYSEPGYQKPRSGVVFGNANTTLRWQPDKTAEDEQRHKDAREKSMVARVFAALERLGFEFEWDDEWRECDCCHGAVRTSPDSYGWQKYFYENDDGDAICGDCIRDNVEGHRDAYLEWLEGNSKRAMTFDLDLKALGYQHLCPNFEHGLHHGQDADPKKVAAEIKRCGAHRFIFEIDSTGQFDMTFSVWLHQEETHLVHLMNFSSKVVDGPSVSQAMQRGLTDATVKMAKLPDAPGVKYAQVNADGTADVAVIPPEEFVEHGTKKVSERLKHE